MATYIQLINVTLNNLTEEQQAWVEEMAQEHPTHFVQITDGDESLTRAIMLDAIDADQVLYEGYARVVIDPTVSRADYDLLSRYAEKQAPGWSAGDIILTLGAPVTRPSMVSERTTIRLSEHERHIVARMLTENLDLGQMVGRAISKALNTWNQNNPPEEEDMSDVNRIHIQFSEDSLFGGWADTDLYNTEASMAAYAEILEEALSAEYPRAALAVERSINDRVRVNGESASGAPDLIAEVEEIVGQAYEGYGWVRYSRQGIETGLDGGLWCEYRSGYIASVREADEPGRWLLTLHKGEMPPFETHTIDDLSRLLDRMEQICDFEDWQPRGE
ncbi:MAG: hypothetical protein ACLFU8_13150 [Anaerolineales bacterium]